MKFIRTLTLVVMMSIGVKAGQAHSSNFFNAADPSKYRVELRTKVDSVLLPSPDAAQVIGLFSAYTWEVAQGMIVTPLIEGAYYVHTYYIRITHPNGKTVDISVDEGGLLNNVLYIRDKRGSKDQKIRLSTPKSMPRGDLETIKSLFMTHIRDFGNEELIPGKQVAIQLNNYAWGGELLPLVYLTQEDSDHYLQLYNSVWNAATGTTYDVKRLCVERATPFYIVYGDQFLSDNLSDLAFTPEKTAAMSEIITRKLKTLDGEHRVIRADGKVAYFTLKEGKIEGLATVDYRKGGRAEELLFENGLLVRLKTYWESGIPAGEYSYQNLSYYGGYSFRTMWAWYNERGEIQADGLSESPYFRRPFSNTPGDSYGRSDRDVIYMREYRGNALESLFVREPSGSLVKVE